MIKSILEAIPIYWMHFWIPVGVIEKIRKLCFRFLWSGHKDLSGHPWISWKTLACPKFLSRWGLKIPAVFFKALAAKSVWNIIAGSGLWVQVDVQKYIYPLTILYWIWVHVKKKKNISIC